MIRSVVPLLLSTAAATALAGPLVIPDDAWRNTALADLSQALRPCVPRAETEQLPTLPVARGKFDDLDTRTSLQPPAVVGKGYWFKLGWRPKDGTVYLVAQRSPDGQRTVYGPVNETWSCLPPDVRKALGGK